MPALTLPSALRPLNEAGLHLADTEDRHPGGGGKRYVLTCDQSVFNKRLRSSLESSPDYPENAKKMAKAFTELLDSSDAAVKTALEPTVTQEEQSATARGKFQDAAIRLMLQVRWIPITFEHTYCTCAHLTRRLKGRPRSAASAGQVAPGSP